MTAKFLFESNQKYQTEVNSKPLMIDKIYINKTCAELKLNINLLKDNCIFQINPYSYFE